MASPPFRCKFLLPLLAALAAPVPGGARELLLEVARLETAFGRAEGLALRIDWPEGAERGRASVTLDALDAPAAGMRFEALRWICPLEHDPVAGRLACRGALRARGAGRAMLAASWDAAGLKLRLDEGEGALALAWPRADAAPIEIVAEALPVSWLAPLLASRWSGGRLTGGRLDAQLALTAEPSAGLKGRIALHEVGVDSADGRIAAAGLETQGSIALTWPSAGTLLAIESELRGGELLAGPLYVALPSTPVSLALDLRSTADGAWQLARGHWSDPGVIALEARGTLDLAAAAPVRALEGTVSIADLEAAAPRYLGSLLGSAGLADTTLGGAAELRFALTEGAPDALDLTLAKVRAEDGAGRFAFAGLDGQVRWTTAEGALPGRLQWEAARLYSVVLGPAALPLASRERHLALTAPASIALLGGTLALSRLDWRAPGAEQGAALDLALTLEGLELAQLGAAFGWPAFEGRLSGRIPGARYADEVLRLEGGLDAELFGGRLEVGAMSLERPLGVAPTMSADIAFSRLDLEPLTGAFGFGEISGRLDGRIDGLRLVDWSPVAFQADLHTTPGAKGPRRISRRAVNDLSRVGGGGLAAGLQNQVLKLFDTFGYARLGLKCRLADNVCAMDGLDSSGAGYVIVEGSGLPRITVIGHQRRVDWPVLVARLQAATRGQAPIVE